MSQAETWAALLASPEAPYDFDLGIESGEVLGGSGPYPDLEVATAKTAPVKAVVHQLLRVEAVSGSRREAFYVGRLVAEFEDGKQLEVGERSVIPADLVETGVDTSICAACRRKTKPGMDMHIHEGAAYCPLCWNDDNQS